MNDIFFMRFVIFDRWLRYFQIWFGQTPIFAWLIMLFEIFRSKYNKSIAIVRLLDTFFNKAFSAKSREYWIHKSEKFLMGFESSMCVNHQRCICTNKKGFNCMYVIRDSSPVRFHYLKFSSNPKFKMLSFDFIDLMAREHFIFSVEPGFCVSFSKQQQQQKIK